METDERLETWVSDTIRAIEKGDRAALDGSFEFFIAECDPADVEAAKALREFCLTVCLA